MANKTHTIYGLYDPRDGQIRYVGSTMNTLKIRLSRHISSSKSAGENSEKGKWIRSLFNVNLLPEIRIIERSGYGLSLTREKYWTIHYLQKGANLTNVIKNIDEYLRDECVESSNLSLCGKSVTKLIEIQRQLNMDKSKVIRLAITKMHSEMSGEEGT